MTTKLLKSLEALPASSLAHEPIAALYALERARASDPAWVKRRAEAKADARRQTMKQLSLTALVSVLVVGLNIVTPNLVAAIATIVAEHFALVIFTTIFATLGGFAPTVDLSSDWPRWGAGACLLVGLVGSGLLLLTGTCLFISGVVL